MTWEFQPFGSYGPLRFGMTRTQVVDLLGNPKEEYNSFRKLEPYLDQELHGPHYIDLLKRSTMLTFGDSDRNNQRPEVGFLDGRLDEIYLRAKTGVLFVNGVNVLGNDRPEIIVALAQKEKIMLFSGASYYFEDVGVRITAPKFWRKEGSISLYSREGFDKQMDLDGPYEYAPDEITGRES